MRSRSLSSCPWSPQARSPWVAPCPGPACSGAGWSGRSSQPPPPTVLTKTSAMRDDDRARWTKLVADLESTDLSQREFAHTLRHNDIREAELERTSTYSAFVYSGTGREHGDCHRRVPGCHAGRVRVGVGVSGGNCTPAEKIQPRLHGPAACRLPGRLPRRTADQVGNLAEHGDPGGGPPASRSGALAGYAPARLARSEDVLHPVLRGRRIRTEGRCRELEGRRGPTARAGAWDCTGTHRGARASYRGQPGAAFRGVHADLGQCFQSLATRGARRRQGAPVEIVPA